MGGARRLIGLGLLVAGVGAIVLAGTRPAVPARASAPAPVNPGATDPMDISANNSPAVAVDPTDPDRAVLVHRVDLPRYACGVHRSTDGGRSWTPTELPLPEPDATCFAPDVAFAPDGTVHVLYVTLVGVANAPGGLWLVSSDDAGGTWSSPTRVAGARAFQARLAVDPTDARRLYVSWLAAGNTALFAFPEPGYPIVISSSTDGGASWSEPARVSPPTRLRVVAPVPTVADDGTVHLVYLDLRDDRLDYHGGHEGHGGPPYPGPWELVAARSTDGGATWTDATVDAGLVPIERFLVFLPPAPTVATAGDRLHVAFHDGRDGDADVRLWTSDDGGRSWRAPVRVNDTPVGDGTTQRLPRVAVAPDGRVDVVYRDRRDDPDDVLGHTSLQSSFDGGRSFGAARRLTDTPSDARVGAGSERDLADLGSRTALWSGDDRVLAAWTDTARGTPHSGKQDVLRAVVEPARPAGGRGAALAGAALGVAGLAVLVTAGRDRPRARAR